MFYYQTGKYREAKEIFKKITMVNRGDPRQIDKLMFDAEPVVKKSEQELQHF